MKSVRFWRPGGRGESHQLRAIQPEDGTRHTLSYGQYRLSYEVYGSGDRVLVWLHGLLLDANLSRGLARALAAQGNRVVLLDLLGHGRSDKPRHAGSHRMDLYAKQVLCLLDELGVDQVVLGGVSLGTNVSLLTAVEAPERVRGLILEMPVLEWAVPPALAGVGGRAGGRARGARRFPRPPVDGWRPAGAARRSRLRRGPAPYPHGPGSSRVSDTTRRPRALSPARYSRTSSTGRRTLTAGSLVAPNRSTICG